MPPVAADSATFPTATPARSTRLIAAALLLLSACLGLGFSVRRPVASAGAPPLVEATLIDVNSADAAHLEMLPRIGPKLGARIVQERAAHGPYRDLDDLQRVRGIGPRTVDLLRGRAEARAHPENADARIPY